MIKSGILLIVIAILPLAAQGHPGKTDHHGGHACVKGCEEWGLYYKEYHLHDKDGKPIRVAKKDKAGIAAAVLMPEQISVATETTAQTTTVAEQKAGPAPVRTAAPVDDESCLLQHPLIYAVLILLVVLLVVRMNRKR